MSLQTSKSKTHGRTLETYLSALRHLESIEKVFGGGLITWESILKESLSVPAPNLTGELSPNGSVRIKSQFPETWMKLQKLQAVPNEQWKAIYTAEKNYSKLVQELMSNTTLLEQQLGPMVRSLAGRRTIPLM